MLTTVFIAVCAFILSFLLTPLIRNLALRLGWVDRPDNNRKTHAAPIPRLGGVPIVLAYAGSFGLLLLAGLNGTRAIQQSFPLIWKMLPAAAVVLTTGLLDDFVGLAPRQKLAGEGLAAALACFGGIQIRSLSGFALGSFVGVPLTVVWLVGCTNAFNLIDGMDGLASGLGLLASLATLLAAFFDGRAGLVTAAAPLAGALLGFLLFNFRPASIFLGDCGSLWVGFMLGCYGVLWSQKTSTAVGLAAPLMAMSIPLLDTALSITRRFLRREPIFKADRGHVHHRLLDRGLTPSRAVLQLYAVGGLAACFSVVLSVAGDGVGIIVIALFCAVVLVGIQYLRYQEFAIATHLFRRHSLRARVRSHLSLQRYERSLQAAATVEECWRTLRAVGCEFGFSHVALQLGGRSYQDQLDKGANGHWTLDIPLSESEYVRLMCQFQMFDAPAVIAPLADLLHQTLSVKAVELGAGRQCHPRQGMPGAFQPETGKDGSRPKAA